MVITVFLVIEDSFISFAACWAALGPDKVSEATSHGESWFRVVGGVEVEIGTPEEEVDDTAVSDTEVEEAEPFVEFPINGKDGTDEVELPGVGSLETPTAS